MSRSMAQGAVLAGLGDDLDWLGGTNRGLHRHPDLNALPVTEATGL
ncbi:MAG: hypothetical protein ABI563_13820 [Specibacter sp.]